ncbi:MAG: hypothetical protein Q7T11_08385 [Deltaproteobacteria bacterium]|nr:hypothetical protein [Deltaproteobacteria bacterium]
MKKKPSHIPDSVKASLWFADTKSVDWMGQKKMIITSILNRGTWEAVRWAYRFYGENELKEIVCHPQRGLWFPQSLRFWLTFFGQSIQETVFQRALFKL